MHTVFTRDMNTTQTTRPLEFNAPAPRGTRIVVEDHGTYGTTVDANWSGQVRGIAPDQATAGWAAMTNVDVRYFKTVTGAARYLAKYGYDAYGRRA